MLNPLMLGPLLEFGKNILDRFIPDAEEKRKAEFELIRMAAEGDMKIVLAQLEINAREAANPSVFVSGGRPACIWVCAIGFAYSTIVQPALHWAALIKGWPIPPEINVDILMYVLGALLGLSLSRTYEKKQGVASK
jgi:hypothetical protein